MKITPTAFKNLSQPREPLPDSTYELNELKKHKTTTYNLYSQQKSLSDKTNNYQTPNNYLILGSRLYYGFANAFTADKKLRTVKKIDIAHAMNNNINDFEPILLETLHRVSTNSVPISTTPPVFSPSPQTWYFSYTGRELRNETARIQLTAIEALLIRTLIFSTERICSKPELISGIGKDLQTYSGLEMCLSRLQNKFRDSFDERLFRSVRNRGYCLVQDVKNMQ